MITEKIKNCILENQEKHAFFVYDTAIMNAQMDSLSCLSENIKTYYAMKANPNQKIIETALKHPNITWIEIASKWEAEKVLNAKVWIDPELNLQNVIYTWPSKSEEELEFVMKHNIKYLNVESWKECVLINELAKKMWKKQKILIRLNTKHKFDENEAGVVLWSGDTQFGFPQDEIERYLPYIEKLENIEIYWFHMYPATGVMKAKTLLKSVEASFEFVKNIEEKTWIKVHTLDFGGGFGIDYSWNEVFDIEEYAKWMKKLIEKYNMQNKELILELGRYIAADMWFFVTKVNDIKTLKSGTKAVLTLAWTNAHKRPQVLNVDYKLDVVKTNQMKELYKIAEKYGLKIEKVEKTDKFNVYGPFCTSVDKIATWKTWFDIELGDFIVQLQAWAYGKTMSPQEFLSHPEVEEIVI